MDTARLPAPGLVPIGGGRWLASIWAPEHDRVWLHLLSPDDRLVALERGAGGVHAATIEGLAPATGSGSARARWPIRPRASSRSECTGRPRPSTRPGSGTTPASAPPPS